MKNEAVTELYYELSRIYSSEHSDSKEDIAEAITNLNKAIISGHSQEKIIDKMHQLAAKGSDYKTKISTVILSRFWEKEFKPKVTFLNYEED